MFDLTDENDTALHRAAVNGHLPMVEHLVKTAGFDVKDKNLYASLYANEIYIAQKLSCI